MARGRKRGGKGKGHIETPFKSEIAPHSGRKGKKRGGKKRK
jgi:hypothetical protein